MPQERPAAVLVSLRMDQCGQQRRCNILGRNARIASYKGVGAHSGDFVPGFFFFVVVVEQIEQALAHRHARPVRRHVLFDLPAHIHDGIGVGRFQHIRSSAMMAAVDPLERNKWSILLFEPC
jgi:hypothetical protein